MRSIPASFEAIVFLVLASVVWGFVADASANPDIPAEYVVIITLVGIVFTLGGCYSIAASFGLVPPLHKVARRH